VGWKPTGQPMVRRQRDKWVVRLDGIDTETGKHRPRQLGTYPSRRSAQAAVIRLAASGDVVMERGTVGALVEQWAASRVDVAMKTRAQYEWAAGRIRRDLGAVRLDRLDRDDVARWPDVLASDGELSRRSIQVLRMVLRAALADGVATSTRLHRRDLAIVRALGMPAMHIGHAVFWQTITIFTLAVAIGAPLGTAVGVTAWGMLTSQLDLTSPAVIAPASVAAASVVAAVAVTALALLSARAAARKPAAVTLRGD
jgi:hypothetical protein